MKIAIVISTNDTETSWNAFRLANFTLTKKDTVKVFLLGKGVEAENTGTEKFDIKKQMESFVSAGGQILACGTCLKIRNSSGTELCPLSTMNDLYEIVKEADKVLTF
ncbi:MAG TPA: DsrE family protein [Bacteroidia bacterium]